MSKKNLWVALVLGVGLAIGYVAGHAPEVVRAEEAKEGKQVLRHVVFFKFKDDASEEAVKKVEEAFTALPSKISEIKDYEWGTNVSPEGLDQGFTHCFFLTFESAEDRDAYLVHPDHKEFGKGLGGTLDKVCVIDYWAK